jgi:mono/diheme cytochrome c family protein
MKFRLAMIVTLTLLLAACNFSLAEDVTPPPGYVSPTPAPTLGPLFPAKAPSTANGALIFAEKCAPCHGGTGMGDGKQGIQLGVTVPAFGLPEVAHSASLAQWYTTVTQGNMERFMPPFASLNDQERWDVVAYAMTLHTSEAQIAKGKQLFEANCAGCSTDFFKDQTKMAALSEVELARIVKQGNDQVKPFGAKLSDDDIWAVTAYLRTLSFDTAPIAAAPASTASPEPVTVTGTPSTPATQGTAVGTAVSTVAGTEAPAATEATTVAKAGFGSVSGSIENKTEKDLPADLKVTLRGFDHGADPNTGPQEVLSQEGSIKQDGSFVFENVEMPLNRIFVADLTFEGTDLQSGFAIVKEGDTSLTLPAIVLYTKTEDTSKLVIDEAHIFLEYTTDGIQVVNVYVFHNPTNEMIVAGLKENSKIPAFIDIPAGASELGYETMQGSENIQTKAGLAIPPSKDKDTYGVIAYASLPTAKKFELSQHFALPVATVNILVPEGVTVKGVLLKDLGVQAMQSFNFQAYQLEGVRAGADLKLTVSGTPKKTSSSGPAPATSNQNLLIGVGALGMVLILAGVWMYLRDRNRAEEAGGAEDEKDEFGSAEDVMDAIIALDDLQRAKKISEAAYQKRRAELKEILKGKM